MRVLNFRLGFATNSSSSHSIIYVPSNMLPSVREDVRDDFDGSYGWENFTIVSREEKLKYVASQLSLMFDRLKVPAYLQHAFFQAQLGVAPDDLRSVDHQSVWTLPQQDGSVPLEWIEDMRTFIVDNPNIVILGGNDNSDGHPLLRELGVEDEMGEEIEGSPARYVSMGYMDSRWKSRRDLPGLWTFYNPLDGTKLTVDMDPQRTERPRSVMPELLDIKITDHCPFGCAFCYQGSTVQGKHAQLHRGNARADKMVLSEIIQMAADNGVFEIAYGGGEPTLHPEFLSILRQTSQAGVTPSFTTKNLAWFRQDDVVRAALSYVGGIAFSVENAAQIEAWGRVAAKYGGNVYGATNRFTIHIVMGLQDLDTFASMLEVACKHRLHVTLLGYKTTGRGNEVQPVSYDGWVAKIMDLMERGSCPSISVDTALAATHGHELEAADIPSWLYYKREGQHSAYIDAVACKIGVSSYAPAETMIDLPPWRYQGFEAIWQDILTAAEQNPLP